MENDIGFWACLILSKLYGDTKNHFMYGMFITFAVLYLYKMIF